MTQPATTRTTDVPAEVWDFAEKNGVAEYVQPLLEMTRAVFPEEPVNVLLEQDHELQDVWHIVFEVDTNNLELDDYSERHHRWIDESFKIERPPYRLIF